MDLIVRLLPIITLLILYQLACSLPKTNTKFHQLFKCVKKDAIFSSSRWENGGNIFGPRSLRDTVLQKSHKYSKNNLILGLKFLMYVLDQNRLELWAKIISLRITNNWIIYTTLIVFYHHLTSDYYSLKKTDEMSCTSVVLFKIDLTLMWGGWLCPHFFLMAISAWKKESGGPKFHDFSWFVINFH